MNIELDSKSLSLGAVFKLVFVGWGLGVLVLAAIPVTIGVLVALTSSEADKAPAVLALLFVPVIAFGQGLMAGALVCLGLAIYRRKRPIIVSIKGQSDVSSN
jgi:hypothetical protein